MDTGDTTFSDEIMQIWDAKMAQLRASLHPMGVHIHCTTTRSGGGGQADVLTGAKGTKCGATHFSHIVTLSSVSVRKATPPVLPSSYHSYPSPSKSQDHPHHPHPSPGPNNPYIQTAGKMVPGPGQFSHGHSHIGKSNLYYFSFPIKYFSTHLLQSPARRA